MNKDTRNYDDISTDTYASWAKTLGAMVPTEYENATEIPNATLPEPISKLLDRYVADRDKQFPGYSEMMSEYYDADEDGKKWMEQNTKVLDYMEWRVQFIADHPAVAEYLTGEDSELYGLPNQIQAAVYKYRADIARLFPDIYSIQNHYFSLTNSNEKKAYLKDKPELTEYWDYRREYAAAYPQAAPYILSDESLAKYILGEDYRGSSTTKQTMTSKPIEVPAPESLDPALLRLLASYFFGGRELTSGARAELDRLWKAAGEPAGSMENWLNAYVWPTLK